RSYDDDSLYDGSSMSAYSADYFLCSRPHLPLHSFPTRRSSDLLLVREGLGAGGGLGEALGERRQALFQIVGLGAGVELPDRHREDRKSTRLNSSHVENTYAVFCLNK